MRLCRNRIPAIHTSHRLSQLGNFLLARKIPEGTSTHEACLAVRGTLSIVFICTTQRTSMGTSGQSIQCGSEVTVLFRRNTFATQRYFLHLHHTHQRRTHSQFRQFTFILSPISLNYILPPRLPAGSPTPYPPNVIENKSSVFAIIPNPMHYPLFCFERGDKTQTPNRPKK